MSSKPRVLIRPMRADDLDALAAISGKVYQWPWKAGELERHMRVFGRGQLVAATDPGDAPVGMALGLVVNAANYDLTADWSTMTGGGYFANHDSAGDTLYGAEVMVDPDVRGMGIGKKLYSARRALAREFKLRRIRAGSRLRGYRQYAQVLTPVQYVVKVMRGEIGDPTLSFQLKQGFKVLAIAPGYLPGDPDSLGYAAIIEWLNSRRARKADRQSQLEAVQRLEAEADGH